MMLARLNGLLERIFRRGCEDAGGVIQRLTSSVVLCGCGRPGLGKFPSPHPALSLKERATIRRSV